MDPILELLAYLGTLQWEQDAFGSQSFLISRITDNGEPAVIYFGYQRLVPQISAMELFSNGTGRTRSVDGKPDETWWIRYYTAKEWQKSYIGGTHYLEICSRNLPDTYHPHFRKAYNQAYQLSQFWVATKMLPKLPDSEIDF